MFNHTTGSTIGVGGTDPRYIVVARRQEAAVCSLLARHRMPVVHGGFVPNLSGEDDPVEVVVCLVSPTEGSRIQAVLDGAS